MKKFLMTIAALFFLAAFSSSFGQAKPSMDKDLPYKAAYSSSFTMGKSAYAKKVLELWKDFDDNMFDRHNYLADTVIMFFPDGITVSGKQKNIEGVKQFRSTLGTVKSTVLAYIPLFSTDQKEDAVCIWGVEEDTMPDGKVERKDLHEVWWFNKAGEVIVMRQ